MNLNKKCMLMVTLALSISAFAQHKKTILNTDLETSEASSDLLVKIEHAEPLFIDLIRDLGARKGEREWNLGLGMTDNLSFDTYEALVEYEWAPINRLGLEVEFPFTFYAPGSGSQNSAIPSNRLNSIKIATQWSFLVNEKMATSMAIGYINEFELSDFKSFGSPLITGNVYNPFLVVAKRWGSQFHSLIYTGPMIAQHFETKEFHTTYDINTSFHYMIAGTRNFIGVEFNKTFDNEDFDMTIRPQMRVGVIDNLLIGIIAGIPVNRENERLSSFLRLIWEPKHKG
ncbi:HAEPLYID family protein [Aestuariibaculum sp. YM273]|uniref:HAEPLYID family protein n=1 Tax=Aestuariibaculum sp. YM273 TaxID=3070659 RepID=UPI0027DE969D|nr:HAEPLYID family protein [Aestuariibaculum sp. YM273]WMI64817.1 HAEPLYID family protein [Aestuariibaculum sp. YM273]